MLHKLFSILILLNVSSNTMLYAAQEAVIPVAEETQYYSNPLFIALSSVIVILMIFILGLSNVLKGAVEAYKSKLRSEGIIKSMILFLIVGSMIGNNAFAQEAAVSVYPEGPPAEIGGLSSLIFYMLISAIAIELTIIYILIKQIKNFINLQYSKESLEEEKEESVIDKWNASVPLEEEASIMTDHEYDGIRELDNSLPPWWKYGFYFTIVWAFVYLIYFHISGKGDLSIAEYNKELAVAEKEMEEYRKSAANAVDENNVKLITDANQLNEGKEIFIANCAACHGQKGEGGVGPNFTDNYWLHGGSVNEIFKVIKYGVTDKGMKSWKEDLSPAQIALVASYIKSLLSTNPPNQKAPQGELYSENIVAAADSLETIAPADNILSADKK